MSTVSTFPASSTTATSDPLNTKARRLASHAAACSCLKAGCSTVRTSARRTGSQKRAVPSLLTVARTPVGDIASASISLACSICTTARGGAPGDERGGAPAHLPAVAAERGGRPRHDAANRNSSVSNARTAAPPRPVPPACHFSSGRLVIVRGGGTYVSPRTENWQVGRDRFQECPLAAPGDVWTPFDSRSGHTKNSFSLRRLVEDAEHGDVRRRRRRLE